MVDLSPLSTLLLPKAVDGYGGPENSVPFIEAFVEGLDLEATGLLHVSPSYPRHLALVLAGQI
ncbi:MAG: hypothetical protein EOQ85_17215 [Mesorhizobium sp.]|nr:MAG: hypothetical protein EOQ85_17215 [Mesorhizobium sp.]